MILPVRNEIIYTKTDLTAANLPAASFNVPIPRKGYPLEALIVQVNFTASANSWANQIDWGIANLVKRFNLQVFEDAQPRPVFDISGGTLLFLNAMEGLNLDNSTLASIAAWKAAATTSGGVMRMTYVLNMVHPQITDKLRLPMCLPIHQHRQDPILRIDIAAAADISTTVTDPLTALTLDVVAVYRQGSSAEIAAIGNFIRSDVIETTTSLAASQTGAECKIPLNTGGSYCGVGMAMFAGASPRLPGDISASTTAGSETIWRLDVGGITQHYWRMRQLKALNDMSRPLNSCSHVYSPNIAGGAPGTGTAVQNPFAVYLDRLTDGVTEVRELGSVLNTNEANSLNQKVEIVGTITTPATYASAITIAGRRLLGDLSAYQLTSQVS